MAEHAIIQTTARNDRGLEDAKKKAAGILQVPSRGRQELVFIRNSIIISDFLFLKIYD